MEVLGLLGQLQEVIGAAEQLKERYRAYRDNPQHVEDLLCAYLRMQSQFVTLEAQCSGNSLQFPQNNHDIFYNTINQLKRTFSADAALLRKKASRMENRIYRMARAKSTADVIRELNESAERAEARVRELNSVFATAVLIRTTASTQAKAILLGQTRLEENVAGHVELTAEQLADALRRHQSEKANEIVRAVQENLSLSSSQEEFCSVTDGKAVPPNPPRVSLDLDAKDEQRRASTFEARLKEAVLKNSTASTRESRVSTAVAARGIGGTGKSCALRALAGDRDVQRQFPDGIFYVSLGKDATIDRLIEQLGDIVELSGGRVTANELRKEKRLQIVITKVKLWFDQRTWLLLVDDVWNVNDIDAGTLLHVLSVLSPGSGSCLAFTTRSREIGVACGDIVDFSAREPLGSQSTDILFNAARLSESMVMQSAQKSYALQILRACAGLPLALAVSGNTIRVLASKHRDNPIQAVEHYGSILVHRRQELLQRGAEFYGALESSLSAALDILDSPQQAKLPSGLKFSVREMHRALAVLNKQGWAPTAMLQRLWDLVEDEFLTVQVMELLEDFGLAELEVRRYGGTSVEGLRVHDLIHDYCQKQAEDDLPAWHRRLLENFLPENANAVSAEGVSSREWWRVNLLKEGYLGQNLCRHLVGAGLGAEAVQLLLNPRWTAAQIVCTGALQARYDYELLRSRACDVFGKGPRSQLIIEALSMIAEAISLGAEFITRNPAEVWFQLYGRLLPVVNDQGLLPSYLEDVVQCATRPWLKPLTQSLPCPGGPLIRTVVFDVAILDMHVLDDKLVVCGVSKQGIPSVHEVLHGQDVKRLLWQSSISFSLDELSRQDSEPLLTCVACSRDGRRVAVGMEDSTLKVWDTLSGKPLLNENGDGNSIDCVSFSPNGDVIASGTERGIGLWGVDGINTTTQLLYLRTDKVTCLAFSPNGKLLASGSVDAALRLWDSSTGTHIGTAFLGHLHVVTSVSFSKDGKRIVSGGADQNVLLWEADTGTLIRNFAGHSSQVKSVAFSDDGRKVVSGSGDESVRLWDVETATRIDNPLHGHSHTISAVSFTGDAKEVVSSSYDGSVRFWRVGSVKQNAMECSSEDGRYVSKYAFSPSAEVLVCWFSDRDIQFWDTSSAKLVATVHQGLDDDSIKLAHFSDDGDLLVSASWMGVIRFWNPRDGSFGHAIASERGSVSALSVSCDKKHLVTGGRNGEVRIWDVQTGKVIRTALMGHREEITCVAFSLDEKRVVSGSRDHELRIWDSKTLEQVGTSLAEHTEAVHCVSFSPDGGQIASGSADNAVCVWNITATSPAVQVLRGHNRSVTDLTFSQEPNRLVSVSRNSSCRLWNLSDGSCLAVDDFFGFDVRRHPWAARMENEPTDAAEKRRVRFSANSVAYGASGAYEVLATIEATDARWDLSDSNGKITALTERGPEFFQLME